MSLRTGAFPPCVLFVAAALAGCGGGKVDTRTVPVSGTVTLDGKPLADGVAYFRVPATGAVETLAIKDGRFAGHATEGEHRVEINSYKVETVGSGEMKGEVKENQVGEKFNLNSTLTAKVVAPGPNEFKFEVQGK